MNWNLSSVALLKLYKSNELLSNMLGTILADREIALAHVK